MKPKWHKFFKVADLGEAFGRDQSWGQSSGFNPPKQEQMYLFIFPMHKLIPNVPQFVAAPVCCLSLSAPTAVL